MQIRTPAAATRPILFIRHGQTEYNRRQIRCGGDVDIPLTADGEDQARLAGESLRCLGKDIDVMFVSPLERTRRTAEIVRGAIGSTCPLVVHDGLLERRLGEWNGRDIGETQPLFDAGRPPPGGEPEEVFRARIARALADVLDYPCRLPLVVASKGVARVFGILTGAGLLGPAGNAQVIRFDIPDQALA